MDFISLTSFLKSFNGLEAFGLIILFIIFTIIPAIILKIKNRNQLKQIIDVHVNKALIKWNRIKELQDNILQEQMSCVDKSLISIKNTIMEKYKNHNNTNNRDIRAFSKILDYTLNKTKTDKLKLYIKSNHFLEKTDSEFKLYKQSIVQTLKSYHIMLLDEEYYSEDFVISRKDLLEWNQPIMYILENEIINLLDELKCIAFKNDQEIRKLQ